MIPVSIIVPVYNVERYICRCIDSILNQTFVNYELILVEDGSPDNSAYICDEYAKSDERISVIHKENGGLSSARNAGIDAAKGEYLFFVDGDDVIHPETLEILYSILKDSNAQISIGNFCRFCDDKEVRFETIKEDVVNTYSGVHVLGKLYDKNNASRYVSACGKLIQRSLFVDVRFPEGRLFEDEFTTYLLYYKAERVSTMEIVLYYYYVNDGGITKNLTLQKYFDEYDAQWKRILFYKEKNLKEIYHKALLFFLDSGQWTLIACREKREIFDVDRGEVFEKQYREVLHLAQEERILNFLKHYDYYILGKPELVLYYRIKRILMKCFDTEKYKKKNMCYKKDV
ncbi:glycosyltransferase family 2 protein [Faecalicatena contorta]|uniref:glycosyltransferase family 2 protein n=1 Tax=Faecalicatena contorta TaxID=39482 RepID=UPI001F19BCAC|nr:glycosyltransferase family 2 protein [Faecalicatena contorta]MCF2669467.1 glycosyltransferase family 2 protein [Faecalicatena contorta]